MAPLVGNLTHRICPPERTRTADLGLLTLRVAAGSLLAAHGAKKLVGAFNGPGLDGIGSWLESIGFRPGKPWALLAGLSEFGGGALSALGLGGPLGPITLQGAMFVAIRKAHWQLPVWASSGGAEGPILYSAIGFNLAMTGPGRYSLDHLLGLRVPKTVTALTAASVAAGILYAERTSAPVETDAPGQEEVAPKDTEEPARAQPADETGQAPRETVDAEAPFHHEEPGPAAAAGA